MADREAGFEGTSGVGPPRRRPAFSLALVALLALSFLICLAFACDAGSGSAAADGRAAESSEETEDRDAIAVELAPVERSSISSTYTTSATLRADRRATVIARTAGVIEQLLVEEGDAVRAEQPLARLEDEEQRYRQEIAATAEETTAREHERARSLLEQGLLSPEEYDAKRRAAEEAEHQAALAELTLSRTVIRAPFAGRVLVRHLDIGATVSDGTPIYDLADLDPLYADVKVPERHVTGLSAGQRVRLVADATGQEVEARIERIGHEVDPQSGTVKVTLTVTGRAQLRPGAFVRVQIVTDTHPDALVVPRAALVSEGSRWSVFRLSADGESVERIDVEPGFEDRDRVEVEAAGGLGGEPPSRRLRAGDPVVVAGAAALSDGARVQPIDASREEAADDDAGRPPSDIATTG